jgi:hypothetical protein
MRAGACPRWTNDSRTTLLVAKRPAWPAISGVTLQQASPIWLVAGQGVSSAPFGAGFPVIFLEEAMMPIGAGVEVSIGLIVTAWAPEQLAPFHFDAASSSLGEPLPRTAAP